MYDFTTLTGVRVLKPRTFRQEFKRKNVLSKYIRVNLSKKFEMRRKACVNCAPIINPRQQNFGRKNQNVDPKFRRNWRHSV